MNSKLVSFSSTRGHELAARWDYGSAPPRAVALFAHCFTCSKDLKAVRRISRALVDRGIGVLRFDFTGLGESEGEFGETNFTSNVEDLLAAAEYLRRGHGAPSLLIGHSLGGAAALVGASEIPECKAVATIGAPSSTRHLQHSLLASNPQLAEADEGTTVVLAGRRFRLQKQLIEDLGKDRVETSVGRLGRALLVLHSPVDDVVDIDHARRIYQAAKHPKSFVSLDSADHLLLQNPADARYAAEVLATWAGRYLDLEEAPTATTDADEVGGLDPGEVVVRGGRSFVQDIRAGRHRLVADEPESVGGSDRGPNPYDFLLTALGTCVSMTLRMYANRKGWPLEAVEVRLRHQKIHARDCSECETAEGKIDRIDRTIELVGDLDPAQRQRLMEIADRCPVHRTLTSETFISTEEKTGDRT